jgi:uncharacterized protein YfiM (DUF2279 family)
MCSRSISLSLLLLTLRCDVARADDWWGRDKAYHLAVSFAMAASWYGALSLVGDDPPPVRLAMASSLAVVPGLLKEVYDSGRPGNAFSAKDMTWDVLGVALGCLAGLAVDLWWAKTHAGRHRRVSLFLSSHHAGAEARF